MCCLRINTQAVLCIGYSFLYSRIPEQNPGPKGQNHQRGPVDCQNILDSSYLWAFSSAWPINFLNHSIPLYTLLAFLLSDPISGDY